MDCRRGPILIFVITLATGCEAFIFEGPTHHSHLSDYCYLGSPCWPTDSEIFQLDHSIDGDVLTPLHPMYRNISLMKNLAVTKYPAFIVRPHTREDVQKAVFFATHYRIQMAVQSSGHSYTGRSTVHGGMLISMSKMQDINVRTHDTQRNPAGEVDVYSGNTWERVYREVDKQKRVVVGGSAHTVCVAGFTLGGGHSPVGRMLGMGADNLLEVEMITATGAIIVASENGTRVIDDNNGKAHTPASDPKLLWALKGGGGGVFGIVTRFTFKLHFPPKSMAQFAAQFPILNRTSSGYVNIGNRIIADFADLLRTSLAPEWGGYILMSPLPIPNTPYSGLATMFFNHFGEWGSPSFNTILPFVKSLEGKTIVINNEVVHGLQNKTSFWEYEKQTNDPIYFRNYVMSTILQNDSFTPELAQVITKELFNSPLNDSAWGVTVILLGGKNNIPNPDSTPVNPPFRTGLAELAFGLGWQGDGSTDIAHQNAAAAFVPKLLKLGKGSYYNESPAYLPNWKTDYWGHNYAKLRHVKVRWDPHNVFTCHHCVRSDERHNIGL